MKISVQSIFEIKRILLLFCLYQNYHWIPNYQEVMVIISLKNLSLPQFCACPNPEPVFPRLNFVCVFFLMFKDLRWEVTVRFFLYWWKWCTSLFELSFHNFIVLKRKKSQNNYNKTSTYKLSKLYILTTFHIHVYK